MIDYRDVCSWIEGKYDITLFPSQEKFIRNFGRTCLTKWYTEYLNEIYANKAFCYDADMVITGDERAAEDPSYNEFLNKMRGCYMQSAILGVDHFRREYLCEL